MRHHRWVVVVTYRLSQEQAAGVHATDFAMSSEDLRLDHENRIAVSGPGCLDCEGLWKDVHEQRCEAPRTGAIIFGSIVSPAVASDVVAEPGHARSEDATRIPEELE
jgi:hypothetical protein